MFSLQRIFNTTKLQIDLIGILNILGIFYTRTNKYLLKRKIQTQKILKEQKKSNISNANEHLTKLKEEFLVKDKLAKGK